MKHIPNIISLLRMAMIVPIALVFHRDPAVGLAMFITAAAMDGVDGYLARRFDAKSEIGATLDPLADKVLYLGMLAILVIATRDVALYLVTAASLVPESLLMVIRIPAIKRQLGGSAAATVVGKIKMVTQCLAITILTLGILGASQCLWYAGLIFAGIGFVYSCLSLHSHINKRFAKTA